MTQDSGSTELTLRTTVNLFVLTCVAGIMDALSYLRSGVFTANMTENTVVLGLAVVGPDRSRLLLCTTALCAFAAGALMAGFVLVQPHRGEEWRGELKLGVRLQLPFVVAFALLLSFSSAPTPHWTTAALIATAACALGIQSVAVRRLRLFRGGNYVHHGDNYDRCRVFAL